MPRYITQNLKRMKALQQIFTFIISSCLLAACSQSGNIIGDPVAILKPRLVVLTDVAPGHIEPDDMESLIRLLVHADLYEIEALIASGGWNSSGGEYPQEWMDSIFLALDAYEKDLPNLMKRSIQDSFLPLEGEAKPQKIGYWPSADYLKSRVVLGSLRLGIAEIGEDNDSDGSSMLIRLADEVDERPLWVTVWGGANTLAQAIWRVKQERSEEDFKAFLSRLRVYTITDQDVLWGDRANYSFSSHQWLRSEFEKDLFFIWDESAWLSQNGLGAMNWDKYAEQIQGHGNLGKIYPKYKYGVEGDTPSFLYVMPNGLNIPENPGYGGWGGYFEWGLGKDSTTWCYTNHSGAAKESSQRLETYLYPVTFSNFAARMDWANEGKGNRNPEISVNGSSGFSCFEVTAKPGSELGLDASGSTDPDGDKLSYRWWTIPEAGTYDGKVEITDTDQATAKVVIPDDASGKTIHVICEVIDSGEPALCAYKRIILSAK